MNSITLTIPLTHSALTRASDMLHGLAVDLTHDSPTVKGAYSKDSPLAASIDKITKSYEHQGRTVEVHAPREQNNEGDTIGGDCADVLNRPGPEASEVFGAPKSANGATEPSIPATEPSIPATEPSIPATEPSIPAAKVVSPVLDATAPAGVDTAPSVNDPDTLVPWDVRIHGSSKEKLAKKPFGWKMKRNVDPLLVAGVEFELRAAMAAGGNVATVAAEPSPAAAPASPAPAYPTSAITTFPALMSAITAAKLDTPMVLAVVNACGLPSVALLASRPDLVPAVAEALGL